MLAIDMVGIYPEIQFLYTGLMTPGEVCYKVYWLATTDPCIANSPENLLSPLTLSCLGGAFRGCFDFSHIYLPQ